MLRHNSGPGPSSDMVASIRRADRQILTEPVLTHQAIIESESDHAEDIQEATPVTRHLPSFLVILALGGALSTGALATPLLQQQFKDIAKPPPGSRLYSANCRTCHGELPKLNAFGL